MKSQALLKSFTSYCEQNPKERFWQALRNWSGHAFIMWFDGDILSLRQKSYPELDTLEDTFYKA